MSHKQMTQQIAQKLLRVPGSERLLRPMPANASEHVRKRREDALEVFLRCCELWTLADKAHLYVVRDRIEPALLIAYDCCFDTSLFELPQIKIADAPNQSARA